jgi:hypothetical protein
VSTTTTTSTPTLSGRPLVAWRAVQLVVWLIGLGIVIALFLRPQLGLHAFWNVLIPVAPALLAVAPGLWRNICPLASTALFPRHMGLSKRRRLPPEAQAALTLVAILALLLLVPLRHVVLDLNGPATAWVILALAGIGIGMGLRYEWKSGWCSSLCPVHPVEKLYGSEAGIAPPNAHCDLCHRCVTPCPDSTPGMHPLATTRYRAQRVGGTLLVGGFAGYIWGWFQVPDYAGREGLSHLGFAYGAPFLGLLVTLFLFVVLRSMLPRERERVLILSFAAAALACYYWFRLPALFGFGPHPGDGMLVDLRDTLPAWFPHVSRFLTTALAFLWLTARAGGQRAWSSRPGYAATTEV